MRTVRFPAACVLPLAAARLRLPSFTELAVIALAGALAAVASHVAIDVAGDYLLPHDTYDDIAHGSRQLVVVAALLGSFAIGLRVLAAAFDEASGREAIFFALVDRIRGRSMAWFAVAVALTAVMGLVTMECLDASLAGKRIDDFGDLLGGSIPLGFALTFVIATVAAAICRLALGFIASARRALVHTIVELALHLAPGDVAAILSQRARPVRALHHGSILARRSGMRAPPTPFGTFDCPPAYTCAVAISSCYRRDRYVFCSTAATEPDARRVANARGLHGRGSHLHTDLQPRPVFC